MSNNQVVVDSNIIGVAKGIYKPISPSDKGICQKLLIEIFEGGRTLVLDNTYFVLGEYGNILTKSGQGKSIGDAFVKWIHRNREKCCHVEIHPKGVHGDFEEFPGDDALKKFDLNDRKFVAVCVAAKKEPTICNGTDSDWYHYQSAFNALGITVKNICNDEIKKWSSES